MQQGFAAMLGVQELPPSPARSRRAPVQGRACIPGGAGVSGDAGCALPWLPSVAIQVRSQSTQYGPERE